jgi:formamidopyrimidine-DNA glycosylase
MPELPEVETLVRSLRRHLVGAALGRLWWSRLPLRLGRPPDLAAIRRVSAGGRVADVRRRGKYLVIELHAEPALPGSGQMQRAGAPVLVVHLGMSGRLQVVQAAAPRAPHTHLVWKLDGDRQLRFVDPRRFGWVGAARDLDLVPELAALGPDPLTELDPDQLVAALASSRAPIKVFLLDQRRVAGLGNIYVCEALFRAGVSPATPARRARPRAVALCRGIREALEQGISNRGTTLRDYVDADGSPGDNAGALLVYGREGNPCFACKSPIRRRVDAGRSTFFCPRCQR